METLQKYDKPFNMRLESVQFYELKVEAASKRITVSEIIRELIKEHNEKKKQKGE